MPPGQLEKAFSFAKGPRLPPCGPGQKADESRGERSAPGGLVWNQTSAISSCFGFDLFECEFEELIHRQDAFIPIAAGTYGHTARFDLLLADDQHVGDLLELGLTDPVADLLIAVVHLDPQARSGKFLRDLLGIGVVLVGDRQQLGLHRGEPERECAREMFGQDTDKPFDASEHNPVDHHRTVFFTVLAGVGQVEPLGHLEVELDGAALPGASDRVLEVEVDLRPVEGAVPFVDDIFLAVLDRKSVV